MITKLISEGNKIELREIKGISTSKESKPKTYISQVLDFAEGGKLKISMPIEKGHIIPLPMGGRYDAMFYTEKGLYQCRISIQERYKSGNLYILVVEIKSDLQKYQRRNYYRLEKNLDMFFYKLDQEQYDTYLKDNNIAALTDSITSGLEKGLTSDISGGGMRFTSKSILGKEDKLLIELKLATDRGTAEFNVVANVILSFELPTRNKIYEHRIEFVNISNETREVLIKYIFEEERKMRRNIR